MRDARADHVAGNQLGRALYAPLFDSRDLSDLVGELSAAVTSSGPGGRRTTCAATALPPNRSTTRVVGHLELSYESTELSADSGLTLNAYTAEAGSTSQQALDLLASWTTPLAEEHQDHAADTARPGS